MNAFNIQLNPILNKDYIEIVNKFYLQQNKINQILNEFENFSISNSKNDISITLELNKNKVNQIKELSSTWFRFVISYQKSKVYFVLSKNINEFKDVDHTSFKVINNVINNIYSTFDIEKIISDYLDFINLSKKINKIINGLENKEFNSKVNYLTKYLQKNFLFTQDPNYVHFPFTKSTSEKKIYNFGTKQLFSLKFPENKKWKFINERLFLSEIESLNKDFFDIFPINIFSVVVDMNNLNCYTVWCAGIDVNYFYEKIKTKEEIKNF